MPADRPPGFPGPGSAWTTSECYAALPADVPLVILADHGFRENREWGRGREGRYGHGGLSLEESVVPVVVFDTPA
jgi:hypothetical protein